MEKKKVDDKTGKRKKRPMKTASMTLRTSRCLTQVWWGPEKEEGDTHKNEEIMANLFPNLKQAIISQIKEAPWISNSITANKTTLRDDMTILLSNSGKQKSLKVERKESQWVQRKKDKNGNRLCDRNNERVQRQATYLNYWKKVNIHSISRVNICQTLIK